MCCGSRATPWWRPSRSRARPRSTPGLLRMSDLIAMQPNLNIPLYLVAPDERRQKVFAEVNRPTFSRLSPPLVDLCRFIAFSALRDQLGQVRSFVRYLKPEFLDEVSESCVLEDD